MKNVPLISVCIPVFETEPLLEACLESVITQDFDSFEVVIVSDASRGKDEKGRSAKKIVRAMQKKCNALRKAACKPSVELRFIEHSENRGLIEVRRTLCHEARGFYTTQLDSDDIMESGALSALYAASEEGTLDIIHGTSTSGYFDAEGNFAPTAENRYGKIFYGEIKGRDIFRRWLMNGDFTANTWGKLIKRELWTRAFENIPYTECNMADDVLLFFFIAQYAKSYKGIEAKVYRYRVNSGMSSGRKIDSLHRWKMICSTASVFTILSQWCKEHEIDSRVKPENDTFCKLEGDTFVYPDEINHLRLMTRYYLENNIKQMKETVIPELQPAARQMLCDYWGESFVVTMERAMKE